MNRICPVLVFWLSALFVCLGQPAPLSLPVGSMAAGKTLTVAGSITIREPDGPRGQFKHGFRTLNDSAAEWQKYQGVRFDVCLPDAREVTISAGIFSFQSVSNSWEPPVSASVRVLGKGWHTVTLPWSVFNSEQENTAFLKAVKKFRLEAKYGDGSPVYFQLRDVCVIKAPVISLDAGPRRRMAWRNMR